MNSIFHINRMDMKRLYIVVIVFSFFFSCGSKDKTSLMNREDKQAKQMMQGLWTDENGAAALLIKGDSIFYPDSASMPAKFWIYNDSLYLEGAEINTYKIIKQADSFFKFINENGEEVNLLKSDNKFLTSAFDYHVYAMNTFQRQETDTLVRLEVGFVDCHISVSTTSDRIIKSSFSELGIGVDNTYLDNVAAVNVSMGGKNIYSHQFRKQEFESLIGKDFLNKSILRRFEFTHADKNALSFDAIIGIPDASTNYVIEVKLTPDGNITKRMR